MRPLGVNGFSDNSLPLNTPGRWWVLCLGLLVMVLVHVPTMVSVDQRIGGHFYDSDPYMRLQRVVELHTNGQWYDAQTTRTNAPIGETLHWTRPLDTILLAGAWLGSSVTDFREALEVWGRFISPFLLLVLAAVWYRGSRGILSNNGFIISLLLLPLLPLLDLSFAIGRPDHHSLLNLLFLTVLVLMFRIVTGPGSPRIALAAGVLSGVAIWISVEALAATTYFAAALALLWLWRGKPYLGHTVFFVAGLFAAISLALLIERPPSQWVTPIYNSISVVHWTLAAAAAISWAFIAVAVKNVGGDGGARLRLAGVLAGALVPALTTALLFPEFYLGPFVEYDSQFLNQWLQPITEYSVLLPTSRAGAGLLIDELGPAFIAIVYVLHRMRRGGQPERQLMALLLFGFVCFVPLALVSARWTVYAQALAWLPWTMAAVALFNSNPKIAVLKRRIPLRAPAVGIFVTAPALLALAITPAAPTNPISVAPQCDWHQMATYLSERHAGEQGSEQLLLTDIFKGPMFVWSTPYNVVGAPYGNTQSLDDTFGFFGALDEIYPLEIVTRRKIDLVLVCRGSAERIYYGTADPGTMYTRLSDGAPPNWLEPVFLPDNLKSAFRLYSVSRR